MLDQTLLPAEMSVLVCGDVPALIGAIRRLVVRGAPVLGVAGAFGVALAAQRGDDVAAAADALAAARPTAVNLAWGVRRSLAAYEDALRASNGTSQPDPERLARDATLAEARSIEAGGRRCQCGDGCPRSHPGAEPGPACSPTATPGALVSAGEGTAFAVALAAHRAGRLRMLWVDETRPLLQGARLTAWEAAARRNALYGASRRGGSLACSPRGEVDIVLVGADRIAADGSVANKVGTYGLAVLARRHGVPFVVVAPDVNSGPRHAERRRDRGRAAPRG